MKQQYLLDTDIIIELLRKNNNIVEKIKQVGKKNCFISEITIAELYFGAIRSGRYEQKVKDVEVINKNFKVIPISQCLLLYARLRSQLQDKGLIIGDMDIFIGATAISKSLTMVTGNVSHFERLEGIKLENWKLSTAD